MKSLTPENKDVWLHKAWMICGGIGWLWFFYPIALIMVIFLTVFTFRYQAQRDRSILFGGLTAIFCAAALTIADAVIFSLSIAGLKRDSYVILAFLSMGAVLGAYMLLVYLIHTLRARRLEKILPLVSEQEITDLSELSRLSGLDTAKTTRTVRKLIRMQALHAQLDDDASALTLLQKEEQPDTAPQE